MPYPVPPPAPPPIVNFILPEDTAHSSAPPSVELPLASAPQPRRAGAIPTPSPAETCPRERSPSACETSSVAEASAVSASASSEESVSDAARTAEPLGASVEVGVAESQPERLSPVFGLVQLETDLDGATDLSTSISETTEAIPAAAPEAADGVGVTPDNAIAYYPEATSQINQLQANLQNLRLPILEELAQSSGEAPIPSGEQPDAGGQILIIPEQDPEQNSPPPSSDPNAPSDAPPSEDPNAPSDALPPDPSQTPQPAGSTEDPTTNPSGTGEVVELTADEQQYDNERQVFFAQGNAVMRFRGAVIRSDRLRVNLSNRIAVAEGNVVLTRGNQVLRGERFVYNFVQEQGDILNARGEVFLPGTSSDFAPVLPTDVSAGTITSVPLSQVVVENQPAQGVSSPGGINIAVGAGRDSDLGAQAAEGEVNRIRFEAERIDFTTDGWQAQNVRLTNDPFSPPELEIRSRFVTFTRLSPTRSELRARNPRIVFDQGLSLPLFRERVIFDSRRREPGLVQFGFDQDDRGGLFIQRTFEPIVTPALRFTVTPQVLVQRAFDNGGSFTDPNNFGLVTRLDATLGPQTSVRGTAVFTSLDSAEFEETLRASVRARQQINTGLGPHQLSLEYSYRDRLFNGSLGFQTVQSSIGFVFASPSIVLGNTGINLSYQAGVQYINADTDRSDLLEPIRTNNRIGLTRAQASVALNRGFLLWQGTALPATAEEGLRYSPNPLTPYVILFTGLRGVISNYSSGDTQSTLTGTVGLFGQFGHFSRNFLDYTAFNVAFSQTVRSGRSPFNFDRSVDDQVLSLGVVQQIYGPLRFGFQTSINTDDNDEIDTDFIVEYNRRTYAIILRYNPVREVGSVGLRISDFNWGTTPEPFSGFSDSNTVDGGVERSRD